jgi:hypothetical protein
VKIARFDPAGGPITVGVTCTPNRNGSYTIMLWKAGENEVLARYRGNFINTDDDEYDLDGPTGAHKGRLVEALVVVAIPSGVGPSDVTLTLSQDGVELQHETAIVPPGSPGQLADLFVQLESV